MTRRLAFTAMFGAAAARAAENGGEKPAPREKDSGSGKKEQSLAELKERFAELAARATAMRETLRTLEARLREQNLGLDPELIADRTRMEIYLDEAERAIKESQPGGASRCLVAADSAVARLERRMGARK